MCAVVTAPEDRQIGTRDDLGKVPGRLVGEVEVADRDPDRALDGGQAAIEVISAASRWYCGSTVAGPSRAMRCFSPTVGVSAGFRWSALASGGVRVDGVDQLRPPRPVQHVTHPVDQDQVGTGNQLGGAFPARGLDDRIGSPVDD